MSYITTNSIQETIAEMANTVANTVNSAVNELAGVDVMWFRLIPDKRNQDVIFQSYTLYGVEDCPLKFKAMYSDSGYDDAAITYNIMGLEYTVPLTLDIACDTWYQATNYDGTLPQRGDIVFIPMSNKLLEVVSMTPVKAIGAQITSYKTNLSIYKPSRNRLVGENLKTSIENNTVNLESQFGTDIENTLKNIVDNAQLDIHSTTEKDQTKLLTKSVSSTSIKKTINSIIQQNIIIDGHIISRSYYDMNTSDIIVTYNKSDNVTAIDSRCFSCWLNINETKDEYKNIKEILVSDDMKTLTINTSQKFNIGDTVIIERGRVILLGIIKNTNPYEISVNPYEIKSFKRNNPNWNLVPGFIIKKDNPINLLSASGHDTFSISIHNKSHMQLVFNNHIINYQLSSILNNNKWYGIIINISDSIYIDIFSEEDHLTKIISMQDLNNKFWSDYTYNKFYLQKSPAYITNIRYYDCENLDLDKQLTDLITYNIPNNSHAIINDSVDTYLNKPYFGQQR